jgi:hypothetical protein
MGVKEREEDKEDEEDKEEREWGDHIFRINEDIISGVMYLLT